MRISARFFFPVVVAGWIALVGGLYVCMVGSAFGYVSFRNNRCTGPPDDDFRWTFAPMATSCGPPSADREVLGWLATWLALGGVIAVLIVAGFVCAVYLLLPRKGVRRVAARAFIVASGVTFLGIPVLLTLAVAESHAYAMIFSSGALSLLVSWGLAGLLAVAGIGWGVAEGAVAVRRRAIERSLSVDPREGAGKDERRRYGAR
ncbi:MULTISPECIES: hypothetical protein [unclassified Microbacterium]|uniref:hypothetical protein n=1 Tax=unclassified Microbacterium TaxID=2609290 RepID=UPI00301050F0